MSRMARLFVAVAVAVALAVIAIGLTYGLALQPARSTIVRGTAGAMAPAPSLAEGALLRAEARPKPVAESRPRTKDKARGVKVTAKRKPKPKSTEDFLVADALGPRVPLYDAPNVPMAGGRSLQNPTWEGLAVVFLVKEDRGDWLHVQVSSRPNGMMAWVARSDVSVRRVPNRIVVQLAAHRVSVFHGGQVLLQEPVAVGRDAAPTPLGAFFIDGVVKLASTTGPYGAYQLSVAAFSDVYQRFGAGIGQIALHGTNQPQLLGQGVSHGCVRMTNDTITRVVTLAPPGTPISILP